MLRRCVRRLCDAAVAEAASVHSYNRADHHTPPSLEDRFTIDAYRARREAAATLLKEKERQLVKLKAEKAQLDTAAAKAPGRVAWAVFAYLVCQNAVLFDWVYFRFDWNLVEPITYLLGYSVVWLSSFYYFCLAKEWTWDGLRDLVEARKKATLYRANGFDAKGLAALAAIETDVARLRKIVEDLKHL